MAMNPRLLRPLASGRFDPRRISGLQLWYDYADRSTVLNSISPDTPATDSQTVRRWLDKSGFGRHAEQTSGASQPTADSGGMTFNGSNNFLDVSNALGITNDIPYAVSFAVYSWLTNPTGVRVVWIASTSVSPGTGARYFLHGGVVSGRFGVGGRRLNADSGVSVTSSASISTSVRVVHTGVLNYSAAVAENRINGVVDGSSSSFQTSGNTSGTDSLGVRIGSLSAASGGGGTTFNAHMSMCELLVYVPNSPLTSAAISAIERYLGGKWSVVVA